MIRLLAQLKEVIEKLDFIVNSKSAKKNLYEINLTSR